jgi:AcrR family transcriptional regulator
MTAADRDSDRRARIVAAGLEIFGTRGFATSRIADLCRFARVTERNFYDHFASREELLIAVYDQVVGEAYAAMTEALAADVDDPVAEIRAGLGAFVRTFARDERKLRVNFVEVVGASPAVEAHRRRAIERFRTLLIRRVERRIQQGIAVPADFRLTASALVGAIQESLVDWAWRRERPPIEKVLDELVRLYALALLPATPAPPGRERSRRPRRRSR